MSAIIRLARRDDLAAVGAIVGEAYSHYVARIGCKPGPMLDDYAALIAAKHVHLLDDGMAIRGMLVLIPEQSSMLLDNIAVSPEAQGLGYGRKLLDYAQLAARNAGYSNIRLYTHEMMTENIALYSRIGFVETHRAKEKGLRRVYMTKPLHT